MTEKSAINIKIDKDLKKKLKLIALEEETTLTNVIVIFLQNEVKEYTSRGKLLK